MARVYYIVHHSHHDHKEKKEHSLHERVEEVLEHKPETWIPYEHTKNGLFDIISMEYGELQNLRHMGNHEQVVAALTHLAAASVHALDKMTCD